MGVLVVDVILASLLLFRLENSLPLHKLHQNHNLAMFRSRRIFQFGPMQQVVYIRPKQSLAGCVGIQAIRNYWYLLL